MSNRARLGVVVSILGGASLSAAAVQAAVPGRIDYEASFSGAFPASGGEHKIADWQIYAALVAGDVVAYAEKVDPAIANRADAAKGKPYQLQQIGTSIRRDERLVSAFNDQRKRIQSLVLYVDADGFDTYKCRNALVYENNEFRLVTGEGGEPGDPLSHATIAPSCPTTLAPGFQITAGRSSRFRCWATPYVTRCGWRLPDMPADLKGVIETSYPASLKLRWRWQGLAGTVRTRYVNAEGNRVPAQDSVALTIPAALSLDFVDPAGHVVWTASAAGWPPGKGESGARRGL
jgi:hypothetical protein